MPLTRDGNIVVEGVLASCYASFNHDLAHIALAPIHWFPEIVEWIFGVENGNPGYVKIAKEFGRMVLPHELLFTMPCALLEMIFPIYLKQITF